MSCPVSRDLCLKVVSRETTLRAALSGARGLEEAALVRQTLFKLETYISLLVKWQKVQNLVSPTTLDDIWGRHIYDSLQLLPFLKGETAVDFGTGAGLPGLVLAIVRPDIHFHLVESNQRKCAFLQEAARQTQTKVTIHPIRAEEFKLNTHIAMARAMTHLTQLLDYALPIVNNGGYALFPKGKSYKEELTLAQEKFNMNYEIIDVTKAQEKSVIVKITDLTKK
jgi:16S rRNA (guanine527-N7)-methyltransferase